MKAARRVYRADQVAERKISSRSAESTGGAACSRRCPQIVRSANPRAPFERLKTHPEDLGPARGLGTAGNLAVGEIRANQIDQGCTGLVGVRRRQRVREDSRLHLIAARGIAEDGAFEAVEHD